MTCIDRVSVSLLCPASVIGKLDSSDTSLAEIVLKASDHLDGSTLSLDGVSIFTICQPVYPKLSIDKRRELLTSAAFCHPTHVELWCSQNLALGDKALIVRAWVDKAVCFCSHNCPCSPIATAMLGRCNRGCACVHSKIQRKQTIILYR
jgi:hypothetical protein